MAHIDRCLLVGATLATWAVVLPPPANGQPVSPPAPAAQAGSLQALATLHPWAEDVWLSLLDRDGAYHGRLSPQGVFQRFNTLMDDEYELDIRSGMADPGDDVEWLTRSNGFRVRGASISPPRILQRVEWKQESPISDAVALVLHYRREHSLTATRDYPWLGVAWRDALGPGWTLTSGFGIHFFKPSADLQVGLSRRWTRPGGVGWELDVGVALLDAFNDAIFGGIGVEDFEAEAHFDYMGLPVAARGSLRRTGPGWLFEAHAGTSSRARFDVTFPATSEPPYSQSERGWYAGGLAQVELGGDAAVAAYATIARASSERVVPSEPTSGYDLREQNHRVGALGRVELSPRWVAEGRAERIWRPEDRVAPPQPPVDHSDREDHWELAIARRPARGWTARLAYHDLERRAEKRSQWLRGDHRRLTMEGGFRFASSLRIVAGVRWDLDVFSGRPFDGAHLRLMTFW